MRNPSANYGYFETQAYNQGYQHGLQDKQRRIETSSEPHIWLQEEEDEAKADCGCLLKSSDAMGGRGAAFYFCKTHGKDTP